jgi:diacylglycerol kinase (ATP)
MNQRCLILLNNKAGALHASPGAENVRRLVQEAELDAEVQETSSPQQMRALIRHSIGNGVEKIVVAGGDGTVAIAAQELAFSDVALGIIPQGTFNNFATALRLPQDLPTALRALPDAEIRAVDLGRVQWKRQQRYFTEAAGVGLFADLLAVYGAGTNKNLARGLYAMFRVLTSLRPRRITLNVDGKTITRRAAMCTVANCYRLGQAIPVAPGAQVTDGELDVVLVESLKHHELLPYYRAIRAQMHSNLPKVTILRGRDIGITSRHHLNVHCDDHIIGNTPVHITVQPQALKVLVGRL